MRRGIGEVRQVRASSLLCCGDVPPRLRRRCNWLTIPQAVQGNERGEIFDYDVPADTREARNQLAATLGRLVPPLWREMAEAELDRAGKVGPYETFAAASQRIHLSKAESVSGFARRGSTGTVPASGSPSRVTTERSSAPGGARFAGRRFLRRPSRVRSAKAAACGTTPAPGRFSTILTVGTARRGCWPKTASTWSFPTCLGRAGPFPATCRPGASPFVAAAIKSSSAAPRKRWRNRCPCLEGRF